MRLANRSRAASRTPAAVSGSTPFSARSTYPAAARLRRVGECGGGGRGGVRAEAVSAAAVSRREGGSAEGGGAKGGGAAGAEQPAERAEGGRRAEAMAERTAEGQPGGREPQRCCCLCTPLGRACVPLP